MEVINNRIGTVYERINIDDSNREIDDSDMTECSGQAVRWKPKFRIK